MIAAIDARTGRRAPEVSRYARVRGIRRSRATRRRSRRAATRATARRAARTTRPIRSAIVASVAPTEGSRAWGCSEVRIGKSEHYAVEINPPDYCLSHPGTPVRRQEIDPPSRALRESLREAHFGAAVAQVNQRKEQQMALARFKDEGPPASLARVAPQLRRLPSYRLSAPLAGGHGRGGYRRHRASQRVGSTSENSRELNSRAIFALSRGLPTMGGAMLDQPAE